MRFSPQFLDWLFPVCLLLAFDVVPRRWTLWTALAALMAVSIGISSWLFPHHYIDTQGLIRLTTLPVTLSEIRSGCLVALALLLNICFFRAARSLPPADETISSAAPL